MRNQRFGTLLFLAALLLTPAGVSAQLFSQQAELSLPELGRGVTGPWGGADLSADGNTALIGTSGVDCAAGLDCGAAYIFERQGGSWSQQAELLPPTPHDSSLFGYAASLSGDGRTALVATGLSDCDASSCVAAYVYVRSGSSWSEEARLKVPPAFYGSPFLGSHTVALSGDGNVALVASPDATSPCQVNATMCGVVHVFVRSGGLWSEEALLTSSSQFSDQFGFAVDLSRDGRTALVGGPASYPDQSATVFVRGGSGWTEEAVLLKTPSTGDRFGWTIALSGDGNIALVSAPDDGCQHDLENGGPDTFCGSVSVFSRESGAWKASQTLTVPGLHSLFGDALALDGDGSLALIQGRGPIDVFRRLDGKFSWTGHGIHGGLSFALSDDGRTVLAIRSNTTAVVYVAGLTVADVPALEGWGLGLLALLLAASGAALLARRRRSHGKTA
jgi:hypothetical protein